MSFQQLTIEPQEPFTGDVEPDALSGWLRSLCIGSEVNDMLRIDGFYIYQTGYLIHPLSGIAANDAFEQWTIPLLAAQGAVETLLQRSVFQLRTSLTAAIKLIEAIKPLVSDFNRTTPINFSEAYTVTSA